MIASLPMYLRAHNRSAHDGLWSHIRDALRDHRIEAPETLDHETHHMVGWARPDLVLGQICNLPYRAQFRENVTTLCAMDYEIPGSPAGFYHSVFVVRRDDPAQSPVDAATYRLAYNEPLSNSGYGAPQLWAASRGFQFSPFIHTHAHRNSIQAVATGEADICAIDAHTFWIDRDLELMNSVKVIGRTHDTPGMTLITRAGQDRAPYLVAIRQALEAVPTAIKSELRLRGIVELPDSAYDIPMPNIPA